MTDEVKHPECTEMEWWFLNTCGELIFDIDIDAISENDKKLAQKTQTYENENN